MAALRSVQNRQNYEVGPHQRHQCEQLLASQYKQLTVVPSFPVHPVQHGPLQWDAQLVRLLSRQAHLLQRVQGGLVGGDVPRPVL